MKKIILPVLALLVLTFCTESKSELKESSTGDIQKTEAEKSITVENFLNTPEMISLNRTEYHLKWSSHPLENYYKQEYIPVDNQLETYEQMISVELVTGEATAKDAVAQKIQEIETRKATDRVSNYELREDPATKELILDFMLSEGTGENTILEWNVYRYANYKDAAGKKGLSLFSFSKRGYGNGVIEFGPDIRDNRKKYMAEFMAVERPVIQVK